MFIGREKELAMLEGQYAREQYACVILYGRRRVGKTALVNEFCKGKEALVFSALKGTADDNLRELARVVSEYQYGIEAEVSMSFSDLR